MTRALHAVRIDRGLQVTLGLAFERDSSADEIVAAVADIEHDIRLSYPSINRIYIEAGSIREATRPPGQPETA